MKKLFIVLPLLFTACGDSEEAKKKKHLDSLSTAMDANIKQLQNKLTVDTIQLNQKIEEAKH